HEMRVKDDILGDGGGMTVFKVKKTPTGDYIVDGTYRNVDFSAVGNTLANCGGISTRNGRIWTAEEWVQTSNKDINVGLVPFEGKDTTLGAYGKGAGFATIPGMGITDTNDWTIPAGANYAGRTIKKFQNFNWLVEIDPVQAKAVRKMYNWGRFEHEGGVIMPDDKTVYLTDDTQPAVFFKFVANQPGNFNEGQLFAYKQSVDGKSGIWLPLENSLDSMLSIRAVALRKGATMFTRFEWISDVKGKVYIAETGLDNSGNRFKDGMKLGGTLAKHLMERDVYTGPFSDSTMKIKDTVIIDYYGRVLEFDPATDRMSVFLEGGKSANYTSNKVHLSNPDGLITWTLNGKDYLVIQEDLNGRSKGRVGNPDVDGSGGAICEIYVLDMSKTNPTLDDLRRLLITPLGAEVTGAIPTPDGKAMFVNSQHPSAGNTGDYGNSCTMLLTGLDKYVTSVFEDPSFEQNQGFQVFPNPATRTLYFNEQSDVSIYSIGGQRVKVAWNADKVDISELLPGTYFVQNIRGDVQKLIIQ
ncbi:MAG: alkaline phosphatase PhoX, partial [Ignavibacteria bacterium]